MEEHQLYWWSSCAVLSESDVKVLDKILVSGDIPREAECYDLLQLENTLGTLFSTEVRRPQSKVSQMQHHVQKAKNYPPPPRQQRVNQNLDLFHGLLEPFLDQSCNYLHRMLLRRSMNVNCFRRAITQSDSIALFRMITSSSSDQLRGLMCQQAPQTHSHRFRNPKRA